MKKGFLSVFAFLFMCICTLCASQSFAKDMTAKDLVSEARKHITEISVSEAKQLLDKGGYIILDVREPGEYIKGHLPDAINVPRGLLEFKINKKIPAKKAAIIVYCKKGGRASLSAYTLERMGYKNVVNMKGGWMEWIKAGYPVEKEIIKKITPGIPAPPVQITPEKKGAIIIEDEGC